MGRVIQPQRNRRFRSISRAGVNRYIGGMEFRFTIRNLLASMLLVGVGLTVYRTTAVLAAGAGPTALLAILALLWFGFPASVIGGVLAPLIGSEKGVHVGLTLQLFCVASLAVVAISRL
jgi:hypothetical protein